MPLDYKINRRISCFGSKVYGFKICDCLVDVTLRALESIENINDLWRFYEERNKQCLSLNLFWTYHDSFFIGCCRAYFDWLFSTNYQNLFGVCAAKCKHFRAVLFEKCCLNLTID